MKINYKSVIILCLVLCISIIGFRVYNRRGKEGFQVCTDLDNNRTLKILVARFTNGTTLNTYLNNTDAKETVWNRILPGLALGGCRALPYITDNCETFNKYITPPSPVPSNIYTSYFRIKENCKFTCATLNNSNPNRCTYKDLPLDGTNKINLFNIKNDFKPISGKKRFIPPTTMKEFLVNLKKGVDNNNSSDYCKVFKQFLAINRTTCKLLKQDYTNIDDFGLLSNCKNTCITEELNNNNSEEFKYCQDSKDNFKFSDNPKDIQCNIKSPSSKVYCNNFSPTFNIYKKNCRSTCYKINNAFKIKNNFYKCVKLCNINSKDEVCKLMFVTKPIIIKLTSDASHWNMVADDEGIITEKTEGFTFQTITLTQGDKVIFDLSLGTNHQFQIETDNNVRVLGPTIKNHTGPTPTWEPDEGSYTYFCPVPGLKDSMKGKIIVKSERTTNDRRGGGGDSIGWDTLKATVEFASISSSTDPSNTYTYNTTQCDNSSLIPSRLECKQTILAGTSVIVDAPYGCIKDVKTGNIIWNDEPATANSSTNSEYVHVCKKPTPTGTDTGTATGTPTGTPTGTATGTTKPKTTTTGTQSSDITNSHIDPELSYISQHNDTHIIKQTLNLEYDLSSNTMDIAKCFDIDNLRDTIYKLLITNYKKHRIPIKITIQGLDCSGISTKTTNKETFIVFEPNIIKVLLDITTTIEKANHLTNEINKNKNKYSFTLDNNENMSVLFTLKNIIHTINKYNTLAIPGNISNSYSYSHNKTMPSPTAVPNDKYLKTIKHILPGDNKIHNKLEEHAETLEKILESLDILKPQTLDTSLFNSLKPRMGGLDKLDTSKLLGLLTSTLDLHLDNSNYNDVNNIISYIKKLIAAKSNMNQYNTNEDHILAQEIKRALQNKTIKKLSKYDRDLLLSTPDSKLWRQIIYINNKYNNKNPYDTPYSPGYSYIPPDNWETKRKEIPVCIKDEKMISSPAHVFGSGVPSNALEIQGTGAGQVGSMMPKFSYSETTSGVFTDSDEFNKAQTDYQLENSDNKIMLSSNNIMQALKNHSEQQQSNHRLNDYK